MPNKNAADNHLSSIPGCVATPGATTCTIGGTLDASSLEKAILGVEAAGGKVTLVAGALTAVYHGQ